jgi:hypothetical protein
MIGFVFILVVCGGIVCAGRYNQGGIPESSLRLSERELELPKGDTAGTSDNTPLTLHLVWRVESADETASLMTTAATTLAAWLTPSKIIELGITSHNRPVTDALVSMFLVLEFDGSAHSRAVLRACDPQSTSRDPNGCGFESKKASRLYVVDAGRSVAELRAQYPDGAHFAVVPGVIKISPNASTGELGGYVNDLSVDTIQGLEPLRSSIDQVTGEMSWRQLLLQHKFFAVIDFGRRLEPWNVAIEAVDAHQSDPATPKSRERDAELPVPSP